MKLSQTQLLLAILALYLVIIPNHSASAYQRFRYPARRILAITGDISLPANNFTMDNGVYEVWYEFSSGDDANATNATNSTSNATSNATTNGTDLTNSTDLSNLTNSTNGTDIGLGNLTNVTDAVSGVVNESLADASLNNLTDVGVNITDDSNSANTTDVGTTDLTNVTDSNNINVTDSANGTNSTDTANATNITDATNSTNTTDAANTTNTTNSTSTPTYVTFAIKFNTPGEFFAVGFGSTSMAGSDIWAFEFEDGAVVVSDHKAFGFNSPPLDTSRGGTNDVELLGYEIAETYTLVKVRRAVDTGDSNDAVIQPGSNDLLWAYADSETMSYHRNNKGRLTVELVQ